MSLIAVKAFFHRLLAAAAGPSRVALGMLAFLIGFLITVTGAFTALFGAGNLVRLYLSTAGTHDLVDLLAAAAIGAWAGAAVFCMGSRSSGSRAVWILTEQCAQTKLSRANAAPRGRLHFKQYDGSLGGWEQGVCREMLGDMSGDMPGKMLGKSLGTLPGMVTPRRQG